MSILVHYSLLGCRWIRNELWELSDRCHLSFLSRTTWSELSIVNWFWATFLTRFWSCFWLFSFGDSWVLLVYLSRIVEGFGVFSSGAEILVLKLAQVVLSILGGQLLFVVILVWNVRDLTTNGCSFANLTPLDRIGEHSSGLDDDCTILVSVVLLFFLSIAERHVVIR